MRYYHNPRCAKSREGLQLLIDKKWVPEIVEYMSEPITPAELKEVIDKLGILPGELIRKKEKVWKDDYADKELAGEELILAMIEDPCLMERPILVHGEKAVIGRPPEKLLEII